MVRFYEDRQKWNVVLKALERHEKSVSGPDWYDVQVSRAETFVKTKKPQAAKQVVARAISSLKPDPDVDRQSLNRVARLRTIESQIVVK